MPTNNPIAVNSPTMVINLEESARNSPANRSINISQGVSLKVDKDSRLNDEKTEIGPE